MEKLPEKWCIKPQNEEQLDAIYNYGANKSCEVKSCEYYYHYPEFKTDCFASLFVRQGYVVITFEQFKKFILNKNNMENKSIKINIPEGMEIDKEKSTFEEIVFKSKEKQLPKTWEELKYINGHYISNESETRLVTKQYTGESNKNIFPTKELAEAALALAQLLQLRDAYNDGWTPDWYDNILKYAIIGENNEIRRGWGRHIQHIMTFKTRELRDKFFDNFQSLLETAKPLL